MIRELRTPEKGSRGSAVDSDQSVIYPDGVNAAVERLGPLLGKKDKNTYGAKEAYEHRVVAMQLQGNETAKTKYLGKGSYTKLFSRVKDHLASQTPGQQFEFDCALWYGYLINNPPEWKQRMVQRLFKILYYGGLVCQRGTNRWVPWATQGAPIASTISHTARICIWLPQNDTNQSFWKWLWDGHDPETRMAAGHGIVRLDRRQTTVGPVIKMIKEVKKSKGVSHFGVNIALGGIGNRNPISGKVIAENGKHGHLYLAYHISKTETTFGVRHALLVGTEQSAPIDRQEAKKGSFGKVKSILTRNPLKWVPDQYGGGHGLGGHGRFSATGGDDFAYEWKTGRGFLKLKKGRKETGQLSDYGPAKGFYYDGMYIDLTSGRFQSIKNKPFTIDMLAKPGKKAR